MFVFSFWFFKLSPSCKVLSSVLHPWELMLLSSIYNPDLVQKRSRETQSNLIYYMVVQNCLTASKEQGHLLREGPSKRAFECKMQSYRWFSPGNASLNGCFTYASEIKTREPLSEKERLDPFSSLTLIRQYLTVYSPFLFLPLIKAFLKRVLIRSQMSSKGRRHFTFFFLNNTFKYWLGKEGGEYNAEWSLFRKSPVLLTWSQHFFCTQLFCCSRWMLFTGWKKKCQCPVTRFPDKVVWMPVDMSFLGKVGKMHWKPPSGI